METSILITVNAQFNKETMISSLGLIKLLCDFPNW